MKKLMTAAAIAAAVMVSGMTSLAAPAVPASNAHYYVDANGDGICDICNTSCAYVDANGDGICDNYGTHANCIGAGYVDANGDGICDNYGTRGNCMGAGYVDANGDGICDNYGTGYCGRGMGNGGRHHGGGYGRGRHH